MSSGEGSCKLTNTAGYIVQIGLGFLIVAVLAYKRYTEKPRRHWKIWLLDVSKQCVSAATAHITNVGSALAMSNSANSDPCGWYFVTVVFETTLGVLICFFLITGLDKLFVSKGIEKYASGNYYRVEEIDVEENGKKKRVEIDYCVWFLQLIIWNLVVILSKTALLGLQFLLAGPLVTVSSSIFVGLDQFPLLKLILVMAVVPTIMNSLQFWVQDNFLKKTVKRSESKQIRELFFEDPEEEEDYECDDFEYNKPNRNTTPGKETPH